MFGDMLDDLEWPSLETRREQSSLTSSTRFTPVQWILIRIKKYIFLFLELWLEKIILLLT